MGAERVGSHVECPACGYVDRDTLDLELYEDDSTTETECGRCEAPLKVHLSIHHSYTTSLAAPAVSQGPTT